MKAIKKTALAAAVAALMLLTACTGNTETGGNKTEKGIKITKTAAMSVQTEKYESADFSITVPKGWKVETGGVNIYHSIRVYDPQEPLNQMFVLLKADVLLHSQKGKEVWQKKYAMGDAQSALFAKAPVLANPSTEGFFGIFPQYAAFAKEAEPTYSGYTFPVFDGFKVTERFASGSGMAAYAMGDELLRAVFSDGSKEGEGMFAASVVDFGSFAISDGTLKNYILQTEDGGYYMAYNIMAITAAKDRFIEWESVLSECMKTLEYSDSFVKATN